jgi:folate-binding protein YgfZ
MASKSPLYDLELARGAEFCEYHSWQVADHYGDPAEEYRAVREDVGALDLSYLGRLRIKGKDRVRYLHNMLSNDIRSLRSGSGCYAALLTHKGQMESDLFVFALDESLLLECPPAGKDRAYATLCRYVVADDVQVEDLAAEVGGLGLQGPSAREAMERTLGMSLQNLERLHHRSVESPRGTWMAVRRDRSGCDGYDLWLPLAELAEVWKRWTEASGIPPIGHRALNWLRTEEGIPWFGIDMDDRSLPMEMGLSEAISLTKGCYRGQEIVARVHYRGHLDRRLGAVAVEHNEPPPAGAEVRSKGVKVGAVTSAILSPRLGRPLALCILKLDALQPGTPIEVDYGLTAHRGITVSLPLD